MRHAGSGLPAADLVLISFLLLIVGIALLLVGGTSLVRGASGIARAFNVPAMVVGLTVVAFGTSTPELVVSVAGALGNAPDIAFGNAVGSNLANFGIVLGVAALLSPIYLHGQVVRREVPFLLLVTAVLMVMASDRYHSNRVSLLDRGDSIILLLLFTVFVYFMVRDVVREKGDPVLVGAETFPQVASTRNAAWNTVFVVIGLVLLTVGGNLTVTHGAAIARLMNVPQVVVGIVVVGIGTSLPELVTSAIAAYKKEPDLALGNIVGSNIFNSLVVLPVAGVIRPLPVPKGGDIDLAVGFVFVLALIPLFLFSKARLGRSAGATLVVGYCAYLGFRFAS